MGSLRFVSLRVDVWPLKLIPIRVAWHQYKSVTRSQLLSVTFLTRSLLMNSISEKKTEPFTWCPPQTAGKHNFSNCNVGGAFSPDPAQDAVASITRMPLTRQLGLYLARQVTLPSTWTHGTHKAIRLYSIHTPEDPVESPS